MLVLEIEYAVLAWPKSNAYIRASRILSRNFPQIVMHMACTNENPVRVFYSVSNTRSAWFTQVLQGKFQDGRITLGLGYNICSSVFSALRNYFTPFDAKYTLKLKKKSLLNFKYNTSGISGLKSIILIFSCANF
jgi:hypothetical protein